MLFAIFTLSVVVLELIMRRDLRGKPNHLTPGSEASTLDLLHLSEALNAFRPQAPVIDNQAADQDISEQVPIRVLRK